MLLRNLKIVGVEFGSKIQPLALKHVVLAIGKRLECIAPQNKMVACSSRGDHSLNSYGISVVIRTH